MHVQGRQVMKPIISSQAAINETAITLLRKSFPTASAFVELNGAKAETYGHLALHHRDLEFAKKCLIKFMKFPTTDENEFFREALWKCAVVTFAKCFGRNESRSRLEWNVIYIQRQDREDYAFIDALRDKHIVHDSNPFSDYRVVAAINPEGLINPLAGVDCARFTSAIHNDLDKVKALARLTDLAIAHVVSKAKKAHQSIKADCEKIPRAQLMANPKIKSPEIKWTDIDKTRNSWKSKPTHKRYGGPSQ